MAPAGDGARDGRVAARELLPKLGVNVFSDGTFREGIGMRHVAVGLLACLVSACTTTGPDTTASISRSLVMSADDEPSRHIPELGTVYGPLDALATYERPFTSVEGRNDTVEACQNVIRREARRYGDVTVEVASRGPHRMRGNLIEGDLDVRAVYRQAEAGEVRHLVRTSSVLCLMTRKGAVMAVRELS